MLDNHESAPGGATGGADQTTEYLGQRANATHCNVAEPSSEVNTFATLFAGLDRAHGQFVPKGKAKGAKQKGQALTHGTSPTLDLYGRHLQGEYGLGIVPIRDDGTVAFAAVDIDDTSIDIDALAATCAEIGLPAVPCRSKSGGAHVYFFFHSPGAPAARVRAVLDRIAGAVGYPGVEVFPKQDALGEGDTGNWINLPYFHGDRATRYAVDNGESLSLSAFLDLAKSRRTSIEDLEGIDLPAPPPSAETLDQASEGTLDQASEGTLTWTTEGGKVVDGREAFLTKCTYDALWQLNDGDQPPGAEDVAERAWDRFCKEADTDRPKGAGGGAYNKRDAAAKARYTVRRYHQGRLRKPSPVPGWVQEMNAKHAVVSEDGKATILNLGEWDPAMNRHRLTRSTPGDLKVLYQNKWVQVGTDKEGNAKYNRAAVAWLDHPKRLEYKGVVFAPKKEVPGYYNLWRGYSVNPAPGDWSLMQDHLFNVICGGERRLYDYLLGWMAYTVQRPDVVPEVAVVLRGKRGTGKGIFARELGGLFSDHFVQISNAKHVTGNFNAHLQDTIVAFLDEAFWAGDKSGEGVLKTLITEPHIAIEAKHRNAVMAPNYLHVIIAGNENWVVPAGMEERRFLVLDVSDAKAQDHAHFGALQRQMELGGREAMLHDLLAMDLSGFNARAAPNTDALQEQKLRSLDPVEAWWYECLWGGAQLDEDAGWQEAVVRDDLYAAYLRYAGDAFTRSFRGTKTSLGMFLKGVLPEGWPGGRQAMVERNIPSSDGEERQEQKRKWHWTFPKLEECRAAWDRLMHQEEDWPEVVDEEDIPF